MTSRWISVRAFMKGSLDSLKKIQSWTNPERHSRFSSNCQPYKTLTINQKILTCKGLISIVKNDVHLIRLPGMIHITTFCDTFISSYCESNVQILWRHICWSIGTTWFEECLPSSTWHPKILLNFLVQVHWDSRYSIAN